MLILFLLVVRADLMKLKLNKKEDELHKAFGISDKRNKELADFIAETHNSSNTIAETLEKIFKKIKDDNESVYCVYALAYNDGKHSNCCTVKISDEERELMESLLKTAGSLSQGG